MRRSILLTSATACCCLGLATAVFAAPPPVAETAGTNPAGAAATVAAGKPAEACLGDVRAFHGQMQKDGYWLGGSAYGYGYPIAGYGYGYDYPNGGSPSGTTGAYQDMRPGYDLRTLLGSANILGQDGQQQTCEAVLATTRDVYKRYVAELHARGVTMADGPTWQQRQIAAATPVAGQTTAFRSDQLLDTDVRSPKNEALGSVHDLVMDPKTGKIAYLIIARGGLFGLDREYVPIPWGDFKTTPNVSLLVLDTNKAALEAAPQVTDDQFNTPGKFDQQGQQVDAYWKTRLSSSGADKSNG
jgi:sporulation protein YlmC with PRC-barrel domain